jgi:hypothetical protein
MRANEAAGATNNSSFRHGQMSLRKDDNTTTLSNLIISNNEIGRLVKLRKWSGMVKLVTCSRQTELEIFRRGRAEFNEGIEVYGVNDRVRAGSKWKVIRPHFALGQTSFGEILVA